MAIFGLRPCERVADKVLELLNIAWGSRRGRQLKAADFHELPINILDVGGAVTVHFRSSALMKAFYRAAIHSKDFQRMNSHRKLQGLRGIGFVKVKKDIMV